MATDHKNPFPYSSIKLNTGAYMPLLGVGTFLAPPGEVGAAVKAAIEFGYRHIDCASVYSNENEVGAAIQEVFAQGKLKREDLFITSKLSARAMQPEGITAQLDKTLTDLKTSYVDLYLVHQPVPCQTVGEGKFAPLRSCGFGIQDVWREMEKLYATGKAKAIGVSNFPTAILNDVLCYAKVVPAVQQIERQPYLVQEKHVNFCHQHGIQVTAFGSLGAPGFMAKIKPGAPDLMKVDAVVALAKKHGKTPAQILIRWSVETNIVCIPKSVKPERLLENFSVWDFKLSSEEVATLNKLDQNLRLFEQDWHTVPTFT